MPNNVSNIPNRLKNASKEHPYVAGAVDIYDDRLAENQQAINEDTYRKDEVYDKEETNNIISRTPETDVVVLDVPEGSTAADVLDEVPLADRPNKLFRLRNDDNTHFDEYGWTGDAWALLASKDYGIDNKPIVDSDNMAKSGGVFEAIEGLGFDLINYLSLGADNINNNALVRNYWREGDGNYYLDLTTEYTSRATFKYPIPAGTLVMRGNVARSAGFVFDSYIGETEGKIYAEAHSPSSESRTVITYDSYSDTTTIEIYGKPIILALMDGTDSAADLDTEIVSFTKRDVSHEFIDELSDYVSMGLVDKTLYHTTLETSEGVTTVNPLIIQSARLVNIFPIQEGVLVMTGKLARASCSQVLGVVSIADGLIQYQTQTLEVGGGKLVIEYDEENDTTSFTIKSDKPVLLNMKNADNNDEVVSSMVSYTKGTSDEENKIYASSGFFDGNFTIGGYTSRDGNNIVKYRKYPNRFSNVYPLKAGVYKFEGNINVTACSQVTRIIECNENYREYEVGATIQRTVKYDEDSNVTTISIDTPHQFLISMGNADNSVISNIGFISYEPIINPTYHIPLRFKNPCETSNTIKYYGELTMVEAGDNAVVVAGYCGVNDAHEQVYNSYSTDGGVTWHTSWNTGKFSMTWDRVNERLCAMCGEKAYVSTDYGVTWTEIGNAPTQVTPAMEALCLQYKQEEKDDYEEDPTIQRYAYNVYAVNTQNSGIQLENGVICMPMLIRIKKTNAGKSTDGIKVDGTSGNNTIWLVQGGLVKGETSSSTNYIYQGDYSVDGNKWIVDADGYPIPISSTSVGLGSTAAYVAYSKDYGVTWENSPATPAGVINEELCVVEAAPNQVCLNARGGTENYWESVENTIRHIYFQHTPINSRENFTIDSWDADYGTRPTNTIPDSLVNAGICKVKNFVPAGSNAQPIDFWLFSNICNPGSSIRVNQTLRISADGKNWIVVDSVSPDNIAIGGYLGISAHGSNIYMVMEQRRDKAGSNPIFCRLDSGEFLGRILAAYDTANRYFPLGNNI